MNKLMMLALALSITCFFAVMLWAQAGRFEPDATSGRSDTDSYSWPHLRERIAGAMVLNRLFAENSHTPQ